MTGQTYKHYTQTETPKQHRDRQTYRLTIIKQRQTDTHAEKTKMDRLTMKGHTNTLMTNRHKTHTQADKQA